MSRVKKSKMSSSLNLAHDGQHRWAWSSYSRIKSADCTGTIQHIVCRIPRDAFRQSAMTFGEIKQSSAVARYWNMQLQLFLETCRQIQKAPLTSPDIEGKIENPLFQKVYMEWIPSEHDVEKACEYRIHAFLFTDAMTYGGKLQQILNDNTTLHEDNLSRSGNSRKPDPLAALQDHQTFKRVTKEVYFRNICGLACGHRRIENNLDSVSHPKTALDLASNMANPVAIWSLKHACANCKNPEYRDEDAHVKNGKFHFLDTKRVIRLSNGQLFTKTFLGKFLPDYQGFIDSHIKPTRHVAIAEGLNPKDMNDEIPVNNKDAPVRTDDDRLDMNVFGENDISTLTEQEQQRIDAFSSRSDFALMAEMAENYYIGNVQAHENTSLFKKNYHNYQNYIMSELKARCLNPDANISEKGKIILRWMGKRNPPAYRKLYRYDKTLSLFANRVIKIMEEAEQYFLISTAHREFYQVMHARYDAYRRDFGLHLNIFQTGEGATSKSFLFDLMKNCSIPSSIDQLTYETAKANAVDGNRNDTITVCHEAPPGMFRASRNRNMDSSAEAMFKERLTSQHVSCKTFFMDEATGKRSQRTTKSECIGVWFGATNDPPDEVEEALKTRFLWGNFEKLKRTGKDIDDCINGERALSRKDRLSREEVMLEWKEEQARVFLIEKMIWCKAIRDVEMGAFYIIKQKFKKKYDGKSVREAETRDWQRVFIFARIQAICTALAAVFQVPDAVYYGQPFEEEQLLAVEPYLVCTEEMVYFTLTMMDSQFLHPAEHKILRKLYHDQTKSSEMRFGNPKPEDNDSGTIDYNYVKILGQVNTISTSIQGIMSGQEGKTSIHNIKAYLLQLCKSTIKSKEHVVNSVEPKSWPEVDPSSRVKRMTAAFTTGDAMYIHVQLLKEHQHMEYDPVLDTIHKLTHSYQRPKKCIVARKYFFQGKVLQEKQFYIFNTITRQALPHKFDAEGVCSNAIKYINVLHNSKASKQILCMDEDTDDEEDETRTQEEILINMDIDDWAFNKRESDLGGPCNMLPLEELGLCSDKKQINYPLGLCTKVQKRDDIELAVLNKKKDAARGGTKRKAVSDAVGQPDAIRPYTGAH